MNNQMSLFEDPTPVGRTPLVLKPDPIKQAPTYADTGRRVRVHGTSAGAVMAEVRPALARNEDPDTSHEAAASVSLLVISELHRAILEIFRVAGCPMNDEEIRTRYEEARANGEPYPSASVSGIRSRRAELVDNGNLRNSGQTTLTPRGRKSILWELAPEESLPSPIPERTES